MGYITIGEWGQTANAGGIRRLRLVAVQDVIFLRVDRKRLTVGAGSLVLADGSELAQLCFSDGSAMMSQSQAETEQGVSWPLTITADVPQLRPDVLAWFDARANYRWLILVEDGNGRCWLGGQLDTGGLRLTINGQTGSKGGDKNQLKLTLAGTQWYPVCALADFDWDELFLPTAEFDLSFDESFTS